MRKFLPLLLLAFVLTGCSVVPHIPVLNLIYSGPTTKNSKAVTKAQGKTDAKQAATEDLQKQLAERVAALESNRVSQGSAFVYGTGKALDRSTSVEPAITLARDLNGMAAQALPKPATADTQKLDSLVTNTLSTNVDDQKIGRKEFDSLKDRLAGTERDLSDTKSKYEAKIAAMERAHQQALDRERSKSDAAATKANKFDEANSLWGSFKLFVGNGWKLMISVSIIGLVVMAVWKGGKIAAAVYCPPVALGMNTVEGIATKDVAKGFAQLVKGGEAFKSFVSSSPLAQDVKKQVLDWFTTAHTAAQDENIQGAVKDLTAKPSQ